MGGFIIFNTFRTIVAERRRDIGMLRSIGASRGRILGLILVEGLLQGLVGTLLGLGLGYLMGVGILRLAQTPLSQFMNINLGAPVVSGGLVVVSVALGLGSTLLAGLLPALSASRVTPLEALRPLQAPADFARRSGWGFLLGGRLAGCNSASYFFRAVRFDFAGWLFLFARLGTGSTGFGATAGALVRARVGLVIRTAGNRLVGAK
jgi:putative ABC transport system permease protein